MTQKLISIRYAAFVAITMLAGMLQAQTGAEVEFRVLKRNPCTKLHQTDADAEKLLGKVKTVTTTVYSSDMIARGVPSIQKQTEAANYDSTGRLLSKEIRYPKVSKYNRLSRYFDENSNVRTEFFYNSDTSYYILTDYEYDIGGKLATVTAASYQPGEGASVKVKRYDKAGNCIEESDDARKKKSVYDSRSNLLQLTEYNDNNVESNSITVYTYDDNCHLLTAAKTGMDTTLTRYQYQNDTLYGEVRHRTGMQQTEISYQYDARGNVTRMKSDNNGEGKSIGEHIDMTYSYEYDAGGNWTKRIIYLSGAEFMRFEREIAYY